MSLTKDGRSLLESHRDRDGEGSRTFYAGVKRERELGHDVQAQLRGSPIRLQLLRRIEYACERH